MKAGRRLLQVALAVSILAVVGFVAYGFKSSFGFVVFVFGLGCFVVLFSVGGLVWNRKASLSVKVGVFCLGIILAAVGIAMIILGF